MKFGKFWILSSNKIVSLWYVIPIEWKVGSIVFLPFRNKIVKGVLYEILNEISCNFKIKKALKYIEILNEEYMKRLLELKKFWNIELGSILLTILKIKESVSISEYDLPEIKYNKENLYFWEDWQEKILKNIDEYRTICMIAPPGYGKTEFILKLAYKNLIEGKSTLILVPEITTSEWILSRAKIICNDSFLLWHSKLSSNLRKKNLFKILNKPVIIIGTRSAIFLPIINLINIFVDEAHDNSYFQFNNPIYETITSLSCITKVKIILLTATPDSKIFYLSKRKNFYMMSFGEFKFPRLKIVKSNNLISPVSLIKLIRTYNIGGISLIYLNHRGFSNRILDLNNHQYLRCKFCNNYLFSHINLWKCHKCSLNFTEKDYKMSITDFSQPGIGVEKLYTFLSKYQFKYDLYWVSSDLSKKGITDIYEKLKSGKASIIIMTQIMIKGYHLPNIKNLIYLDTVYSKNLKSDLKLRSLIQFAGRSKVITTIESFNNRADWLIFKTDNYLQELKSRSHDKILIKFSKKRLILEWNEVANFFKSSREEKSFTIELI